MPLKLISALLAKIETQYRLIGYLSLGAVVFIYNINLDKYNYVELVLYTALFPALYLFHLYLIRLLTIKKKKWKLSIISTCFDIFILALTLWMIEFNTAIAFFAILSILYAIYINYKKDIMVLALLILFLFSFILIGYDVIDIHADLQKINPTSFVLYILIFTIFIFSGAYILSHKITLARKRETEYHQQVVHFMDFSQQISHYTPPQLWQAILRGEYQARIEYKRKKLTIFFSDIQGFTELSEKLIAEDLAYILNDYLYHMNQIATQYNATIDKFMGDGILIFFGDMDSQGVEKDAKNCVDMAIAMRQQMKVLRERWKKMGHPELHIRMGISTGYCHVGNYGSDERMAYTLVGREVNLASRIQSNATVDEILLSDNTYKLISDHFLCIEKEPVRLKGITQPIRTWQVVERYESSSRHNTQHWFEFEYKGFQLILDLNEVKNMEYGLLIKTLEEMIARIRLQDKLTNKDGLVELTKNDKIEK